MTKEEVFTYLKSIQDKSGGFKKQESIKKHYPELYNELINSTLLRWISSQSEGLPSVCHPQLSAEA